MTAATAMATQVMPSPGKAAGMLHASLVDSLLTAAAIKELQMYEELISGRDFILRWERYGRMRTRMYPNIYGLGPRRLTTTQECTAGPVGRLLASPVSYDQVRPKDCSLEAPRRNLVARRTTS